MAGFAKVFVELFTTEQGGRKSAVSLVGYRPHFQLLHGDRTYLGIEFIDGPEEPLSPGESAIGVVEYRYEPQVSYKGLVPHAEFLIREGGGCVGIGRVLMVGSENSFGTA